MPIHYPSRSTFFHLAMLSGCFLGVVAWFPRQNIMEEEKVSPAVSPAASPTHRPGELAAYAQAVGTVLQTLDSKPIMGFDSRPAESAAAAIMAAGKVAHGLSRPAVSAQLNGEGEEAL